MNLKKNLFLISLIFVLPILVLIFSLIVPLIKEISKIPGQIIDTKKDLARLEVKTENLNQFKEKSSELKAYLEKANSLLIDPDSPDLTKFGKYYLPEVASSSEVSLSKSIVSSSGAENDPWTSVGFKLSSAGSFPRCLEFLEKLENSSYLIQIESLRISRIEEGAKASLTVKVFTK